LSALFRVGVCAGLALVLLASCGGNDDADPASATAQAEDRKQALAVFPSVTIPTDVKSKGMWGPVYNWPVVAVHAVLMPSGGVLTYGSRADGVQTGSFNVNMWDGVSNPGAGHLTVPNPTGVDLFCGSQLLLPPTSPTSAPRVFLAGGDNWTGSQTTNSGNNRSTLFDSSNNGLTRAADMNRARWYSTSITLTNGDVYVQGGSGGNDRPEVRSADGSFRALTGADTGGLVFMYPRNFVMPDGRVFGFDGENRMYFVNTAGSGGLSVVGQFPWQYGSVDSSAAMFRPGRILQFGGNSNGAVVIDVTSGTPVVAPTQSMASQRRLAIATLLADGQVLATGGSPVWNNPNNADTTAETWNPQTGQWTRGAVGAKPGLYHSNALLLPDASVLVTSGGALGGPTPTNREFFAQVYYPPYLFTTGAQRAARPVITATTDWLEIGKNFSVTTTGSRAVSRVTLVKTGSATHNWNMEQRFLDLAFTRTASTDGDVLTVQAPARAGEATPGFYMLFVFDDAGVPSVARILRLAIASNPNPGTVPTLNNPGGRSAAVGTSQSLQLAASDPNGDTLRYSASGLPAGLALNADTGLITGAHAAAGTFNVVAAVSDGVNNTSISFVWTVTAPVQLTLTQTPTPAASVTGGTATFTAAATGTGVQYQWNFGDGSADTLWLSAASTTKVYAQPGTYVVTMRVRDASGALISRSFFQTVYLPATARAPTASGNLLLEPVAAGNARLWVVNQDNDSITGIDSVTRGVLGEVAVGAGPRSVALAANGLLWVTNKRGASISVVNPATRAVVRTIALPRASQPFGVVMSPTSAVAFVALEATGQLLRFDTSNYTQTGSMNVGLNTRHVSVSADGVNVYVSRFITPALPGEGTAAVNTPSSAGGEVMQVNAAAMTLTRTVVLAHSDKVDAENQGSGIPNYLGAATISPDGSQAFVPSKQDNIKRGSLRNNQALNFQSTVRAVSSRIVLTGPGAGIEDLPRRVDHDNASMASAAAYDLRGVLLFVALETSREVAVVDAHSGRQVMRFDVGRAPQGLVLSADGNTLFVNNFMDRTVSVHDLRPLLNQGLNSVTRVATVAAVATEKLAANVLLGKQFFYDARDTRLSRDSYMSCASCHSDGGHDGRTWDFTGQGEGLRNTISLRGRAGAQGRLHWSANFDEVQDFEGQIRSLAGGSGLMTDAQFNVGTRSQPLGAKKAGVNADLDALSAYVSSLSTFDPSPSRNADGSLTAEATVGRTVFAQTCASCHGGADFSDSTKAVLRDIGTLNATSGKRLNGELNGMDAPTLRDAWATAPYLHNGSAASLADAIRAHRGISLSAADLSAVVAFTRQIGGEEGAAPNSSANLVVRALASLVGNIGAAYDVRVNGSVVGSGQLDALGWVDLFFDVATLVKDALVDVVFKNDQTVGAEDRNLAVQSIRLNGSTTLDAGGAGVTIDQGTGAAAFDGQDVLPAATTGGWLPWNAALRFKVPNLGGSDTVTVRGAATLASGVGAAIELRVNGAVVGSRTVSNTTVQDWIFTTPLISAGDRIDVVFTNDVFANGEDRNLYVESVQARNIVTLSTASGVTIDEGRGPMAFDGVGVIAAGTFGGWVPWNAAMRFVAR